MFERLLSARVRQVGGNVLWLVGDRLFRMVVGVVVLGMVARYLETSAFGLLRYSISLTAIFASVASLGIEGIVIREIVRRPEATNGILGTAFVLRLLGGALAIGSVLLSSLLTRGDISIAPMVLVVSLAFLPQAMEVIDLWFQKSIQSRFTVAAKAVAVLLGAGVKVVLVFLQAPLILFCWATVLDAMLSAVALLMVYRGRGEQVRSWQAKLVIAQVILRDSWPLILSGLLVAVYTRIEQVLVMNVLGSHSVGVYYASVAITEMWNFIPALLLASIYPILVEERQLDAKNYRARLQMVFDGLTGLGYLVAVVGMLLAPLLIRAIYGAKFAGAAEILMIQAWTAPVVFSGSVRAQYFLLENLTLYHTISALLGIVVNVALSLWLMSRIGVAGAAVAALVGYVVAGYLTSLLFPPLRECGRLQTRAFLLPFRIPSLVRVRLAR